LKPDSPGYDEISMKIIRAVVHLISSPVMFICIHSLSTGICPSSLKGNKKIMWNYKAVSLPPSVAKIFKKLIYLRL
jgi:hypothetical protein